MFATLTAPSFGVVHHRVTSRSGTLKPCRPRRDKPTCRHGRALWCNHLHHEHDRRIGQPLCLDCYDHTHQAVWNYACPQLWDRTITRLRRLIRHQLGPTLAARVRIRYAKVAEVQARGVIHLHALIRVDGYDPDRLRAVYWEPNDLVFCTQLGGPIEPRNLNRSLRSLLIRSKVRVAIDRDAAGNVRYTTKLRLHDLRHSCASFLLAQGQSPRVVMEILGHSGIAITMNTYAHVLPTLLGDAATGMDEMFG